MFNPSIPIMDSSELRPGMKGYGLTVYSGTKPERFGVEIKGVLSSRFAGGDMIICQLDHPEMKDIGVIAGMSGSPVFIDDKLIGAVAYGWGFSVRPICGVTPIKSMLEVFDLVTKDPQVPRSEITDGIRSWPEARAAFTNDLASLEPLTLESSDLATLGLSDLADGRNGALSMEPLSTPLMVSTTSPRVMEQIDKMFRGSVFRPVMTGAQGIVGGEKLDDKTLASLAPQNGSAFCVVLCEGDLYMAGLGTLTYTEGDRMVGFGHPMFGFGAVDVPTRLAEVVSVIPSVMRPFKMGNMVKPMGALRQDRLPAVGGSLTAQSTMVPVTYTINAPEMKGGRTFHFNVWNDRRFLPMITSMLFMEAMEKAVRIDGPMNLRLDYEIALEDGRKLSKSEYIAGEDFLAYSAGDMIGFDALKIANNRFEPVKIKSVTGRAQIGLQQQVMVLERVIRDDRKLYPGDVVKGELVYNRWREDQSRIPFQVKLPDRLKPGKYELQFVDGQTRGSLERNFRPELNVVNSFEDLLRQTTPSFPNNVLHVLLVDPREDVVIGDNKVSSLPTSVAQITRDTMRDTRLLSTTRGRLITEQRRPFDAQVIGSTVLPITIEDKSRIGSRTLQPDVIAPIPQ